MQDEDFFISLHFVSLRWEYVIFHKGWVLQTYSYRRLSTLCSDVMKSRKFQKQIRNLATLDVRRVYYINTLGRGAYLCISILGIIIYQRGLRVVVLICWAMREPHDVERQLSESTFLMSICKQLNINFLNANYYEKILLFFSCNATFCSRICV